MPLHNEIPFIDAISARDLIYALYQGGIIEMPYLEGDTLEITSCPVHETYTLRDDLPHYSDFIEETIIGVTDYDGDPTFRDSDVALNANTNITPRVLLSLK